MVCYFRDTIYNFFYFDLLQSIYIYDNFENNMYIVSLKVVIAHGCQLPMGRMQATIYEYGHEHVIYANIRA